MQKLIHNLTNGKISIYQAIDKIKDSPSKYSSDLDNVLISHKQAYIRLFAAWAIGEIQDKKRFNLLVECYKKEQDQNVRANIVRALYFIEAKKISISLIKGFLSDHYYLIQLLALKFLSFNSSVSGKLNFNYHLEHSKNELVKIEVVKNIRFFSYDEEKICSYLHHKLVKEEGSIIKMYLLDALGMINHPSSMFFLIKYYRENKKEFENNALLAYGYSQAILNLNQSKSYSILHRIYLDHSNILIRWKIVEAIISFGGPNAVKILSQLKRIEKNIELKNFTNTQINNIPVTSLKRSV